jgi:hypothetical protein
LPCVLFVDHFAFGRGQPEPVDELDGPFHESGATHEVIGAKDDVVEANQLARAIESAAVPSQRRIDV